MIAAIDNFLNRITMYRLVLYYLIVLIATALLFGFLGFLPYRPETIVFSTFVILVACWASNAVFARVFGVGTNNESLYITALILALIISPVASSDFSGIGFMVFASVWAMASKYMLAIGKKHIFNPAAFGIALAALAINQSATWWVGGNLPLLPFVFLGGILIVRKMRRFDLIATFSVVALVTVAATASSVSYITPIVRTLLHSSFFFLAFVMLTEPLTMPPGRALRMAYGAVVGFLFVPNIHIGSLYLTPELALLAGNLFAYAVSPKGRFILTLTEKNKLAEGIYEFVFMPDRPFTFRPGQYLEWTLEHRAPDSRGNRRYLTIASSPSEDAVRIGVKFYDPPSSYKRALMAMKIGETLSASQLSGDFVLPKDKKKKLVFVAGGIGVTPFRSMVQYLIDNKEIRSALLLYSNKTAVEVAYKDVFDRAAQEVGLETFYALTDEHAEVPGMYNGKIDGALIARGIPDYRERIFYISGPHRMVRAFKKTLRGMGIPRRRIKTDYFPGFA